MAAVNFRTRNQVLLAKVQAAKGTAETLSVGSNAIKVYHPIGWQNPANNVDTDYAQEGLDRSEHIPAGGGVTVPVRCNLKGSGTAGTAPDFGTLLRGCAMSQVLTAADVTGTAQAGASGTITLAAGASSTDNLYRAMVIEITAGTGSGQKNLIKSYVGSTKVATVAVPWTTPPDATSVYAIRANAMYRPVSVGTELLTLARLQHHSDGASESIRDRAFDAAGSFSLQVAPASLAAIEFQFRGRLAALPDDLAYPGAATLQSQQPEPLLGAQIHLGGVAVRMSDLRFDLGGDVAQFPDASDDYGMGEAEMVGRLSRGSITLSRVSIATRAALSAWKAQTKTDLWVNWGSAAGKRVSLYFPEVKYEGADAADVQGYAGEALPFRSTLLNGGVFLACY